MPARISPGVLVKRRMDVVAKNADLVNFWMAAERQVKGPRDEARIFPTGTGWPTIETRTGDSDTVMPTG
jgi:hypothetical protein